MEINEYHGNYNISRRNLAVSYIVCHYVGSGDNSPGNALNNCKYFAGGDRGASAHYFIDDEEIWEYADPGEYYTWHCGDGHGAYGITNSNSIGIEVCIDGDTPYTEPEIGYLSELVPYLMGRFGVPAENVVRHYDASRKACPYFYTPYGSGGDSAWNDLWQRITSDNNSLIEEETEMNVIIQHVNGYNVDVYFDGHDVHDLTDTDDIAVLDRIYQAAYGKNMPRVDGGQLDAPWFSRLMQVVNSPAPSLDLVPNRDGFEPRSK